MEEQKYYVVLKDNATFSCEIAEKIINMELKTYAERFPIEDAPIEVYFNGSKEECEIFIRDLGVDIKSLFEIK